MTMKITAKDFDNLGLRAQALIRKIGVRSFARGTGLSESTVRRLERDPEAIMRASGGTGVLVVAALQAFDE